MAADPAAASPLSLPPAAPNSSIPFCGSHCLATHNGEEAPKADAANKPLEKKAPKADAEDKPTEEEAPKADAEDKPTEEKSPKADEDKPTEEEAPKADAEDKPTEEEAPKADAEDKPTEEEASKADAEDKPTEEEAPKADAEDKPTEEEPSKADAEDKPTEEKAPKADAEDKPAEEKSPKADAGDKPTEKEAARASKQQEEELRCLRREVSCLRAENQQLQHRMKEAEERAAALEKALHKQQESRQRRPSAASRPTSPPSPRPPADAEAEGQEAAAAAAAAAAEDTLGKLKTEKANEPQTQDEAPPQPLLSPALTPSPLNSREEVTSGEPADEALEAAAAAGTQGSAAAAAPRSEPVSSQGSMKWLRSFLSRGSSGKEEGAPFQEASRSGGASMLKALGLGSSCMRCQQLEQQKEALDAELQTVNSRCSLLQAEKEEATTKRETLTAKVRYLVQQTAALEDHRKARRARAFYHGRVRPHSTFFDGLCGDAWKEEELLDGLYSLLVVAIFCLFENNLARKGLELRIAALLDKVYELETSDPTSFSKPRRPARLPAGRLSVDEPQESCDFSGEPFMLLPLREEEQALAAGEPRGAEASSRRPTVLVPAHFFDEAAAYTAQQRAAAAAQRRPTVALPAYIFDEGRLRTAADRQEAHQRGRPTVALPPFMVFADKAAERRQAAAARRPTVDVPAHLFDPEAMRRAAQRTSDPDRRRPTIALPAYLFKERAAAEASRESSDTLHEESLANDAAAAADTQQQQQQQQQQQVAAEEQPSSQSSFLAFNFFSSFSSRSKDDSQQAAAPAAAAAVAEQQQQPEAAAEALKQGPSLEDKDYEQRKTSPVVAAAESDEEPVFPEPGKGARIRQLSKEKSGGAPAPSSASKQPETNGPEAAGEGRPSGPKIRPKAAAAEPFLNAPCCGRSCHASDVRPFPRCSCSICRKCLRTAAMQSKVHINNFVGTDRDTGSPIWKVRCPSCGSVAPLTATQLRLPPVKYADSN
ncbi:hypothetical protein Efla_002287 [Eimeria flavescens]